MRHGDLTARRRNAHLHIAASHFAERLPAHAFARWQSTADDRQICLFNGAIFKLLSDAVIRLCRTRHENDARGFAVEAMKQSPVAVRSQAHQDRAFACEEPVHQTVISVANSRQRDATRGFVQSHKITVAVNIDAFDVGVGNWRSWHGSIIAEQTHICPPHGQHNPITNSMNSNTPHTNQRLAPFGESIFSTMSRLALEHSAVNLGQGFPDFDGPDFVKDAGKRAIDGGFGQYARAFGLADTNRAIARYTQLRCGFLADCECEVTVTAGCTEAIAAVLLGLLNPGDEVVLLDPSYDSYAACVAMAGATARRVRLEGPDFRITDALLRGAFSSRTRAILFNSPHNPSGRMFDADEYQVVANLARQFNALVLSDEVYDAITYARAHRSIAELPDMRQRTVIMGSLGKTFSLTGWKIGWTIAPEPITKAIRSAHQFLTFCAATPLQRAAADALNAVCDDGSYLDQLRHDYARRRTLMLNILDKVGFECVHPEGSYFILANAVKAGFADDVAAAKALVKAGVATIPASAFYDPTNPDRRWLRFAFCKRDETMLEAGRRLMAQPLKTLLS